jgi:DNA-binding NtrC family response regulator
MSLVLIVDDEADVRRILKRWIGGAGHEIAEADSAAAALDVLARRPADVVFCDVQMPGDRDGLWLAGEVRRRYPSSAVVLATGVTTVPPETSLRAGVLAYLVKPFERTRLLEALDAAVKWNAKTTAVGPQPEDTGDRLTAWLESLGEG